MSRNEVQLVTARGAATPLWEGAPTSLTCARRKFTNSPRSPARVIANGLGPMPAFGAALSNDQIRPW